MTTYDLIIIGGGSGGLTAARLARRLGSKVAIVEKTLIGGDCLWTGCVPSKSFISLARQIQSARDIQPLLQAGDVADKPKTRDDKSSTKASTTSINFNALMEVVKYRQKQVETVNDNVEALQKLGIDVIMGDYHFKDAHTLEDVSGRNHVKAKRFLIATGSHPATAEIDGLHLVPYLTSDTIWDLKKLPKALAIIGAGPVGLEIGQAFAMLGTKVTVFERSDRLLSRFDPWVSQSVADGLHEAGVKVVYHSKIEKVEKATKGIEVSYSVDATPFTIEVDQLLVAVGRKPNTAGLNLEKLKLKFDENGGLNVDDKLRTSEKHIYGAGDVLGGAYFTHFAAEQAASAVVHALYGYKRPVDFATVPSVTFTTPEIAQVGLTEQQLVTNKTTYRIAELDYSHIDRAIAEGTSGKGVILLDENHNIYGATIVGHMAGELIGYISNLMSRRAKIDELAQGIQAYPTYTIYLKEVASNVIVTDFTTSLTSRLVKQLRK